MLDCGSASAPFPDVSLRKGLHRHRVHGEWDREAASSGCSENGRTEGSCGRSRKRPSSQRRPAHSHVPWWTSRLGYLVRRQGSRREGRAIPDQKETVRRGYDKLSYAYRGDETPDDHAEYAEWVSILSKRLPEGAAVLDLGCGCGLPGTKLLSVEFDVTGVDFSEVQIRRARQLVPAARFICSDISNVEFPRGHFAAVVSFYAIIHMPLDEHPSFFLKVSSWLRPSGYLLAIVGHRAWAGTDESYLGVEDGRMCWSHADEATYLQWISESGLHVHWKRFIPEGESGHTLVFAQKPPITE